MERKECGEIVYQCNSIQWIDCTWICQLIEKEEEKRGDETGNDTCDIAFIIDMDMNVNVVVNVNVNDDDDEEERD